MNYQITLSESERQELARAFGKFVTALANAAPILDEQSGTDHARAILSPPSTPAAAAHSPAPIELRDRWARDRKGNELPNPEGCAEREVVIWKTEQKPPKKANGKAYLKVTWQSQERGYVDANCFDEKLFPWIIKQTGQKTTLYLVRSGDYLNIAGVRA